MSITRIQLILLICLVTMFGALSSQNARAFESKPSGQNATDAQLISDFLPRLPTCKKSKPKPNSRNIINVNYSADNLQDSTAHLGGDVYFADNDQLGIYGESSKDSAQSTGSSSITTQSFGVSLGTDRRKSFSFKTAVTYFGIKGDLTEATIRLPLTYAPNSIWTFNLTPGQGAIDFNPIGGANTTEEIGDQSIGGSVTFNPGNWQFYVYANTHAFSRNPKGIGKRFHRIPNSPTITNLADQIVSSSQTASIMYFFSQFDLGVEFDKSRSAIDSSISNSWTLMNDIYWTQQLTTSISAALTTTPGTDPSTGKPYPDSYSGTIGMSYAFL